MTGIFSNDTYNNGVTRDNFEQYAHTFDSNARYDNFPPDSQQVNTNSNYLPPSNGKPRDNNNNNNNNNSNAGKWGAIIIIAIIIFGSMFAINLYYNMQDLKYFEERKDQAEERLQILEEKPAYKELVQKLTELGYEGEELEKMLDEVNPY